MTEQELIEKLADAEHASWARWMAYLFSKCERVNGSLYIPETLRIHWQRQIDTPYSELSEREKQSDRDEVAHILPIIREHCNEDTAPAIGITFSYIGEVDTIKAIGDELVERCKSSKSLNDGIDIEEIYKQPYQYPLQVDDGRNEKGKS